MKATIKNTELDKGTPMDEMNNLLGVDKSAEEDSSLKLVSGINLSSFSRTMT